MQPAIYTKEKTFSSSLKPGPSVSIIMPFEPKMVAKSKLQYQLKMAVENAEEKLLNQYSAFTQGLIIEKIKALIAFNLIYFHVNFYKKI